MSFLERIGICHQWEPADYRRFTVDGVGYGFIPHKLAERLSDFPDVFSVSADQVKLVDSLSGFGGRSAAVAEVIARLVQSGDLPPLRGEDYPLRRDWQDVPLLKLDRCAAAPFGIRSFGVHVNGITRCDGRLQMWIGRRALDKPSAPGKLDHIVAGGQPYGLSIMENLIKECAEEADVPRYLAERATPVGMVTYRCKWTDGLRDDVAFCYDLELPEDFTPRNTDGEVEEFYLWPIEEVIGRVRDSDDFKFNVNLVIIDFLVRWGFLGPDDPDYMKILEGLRRSESA